METFENGNDENGTETVEPTEDKVWLAKKQIYVVIPPGTREELVKITSRDVAAALLEESDRDREREREEDLVLLWQRDAFGMKYVEIRDEAKARRSQRRNGKTRTQ